MFGMSPPRERRKPNARRRRRAAATIEPLEARRLPSIAFLFDYKYDRSGYFSPARRAILELAGRMVADRIDTPLKAIRPGPGRAWTTTIRNPQTGAEIELNNPRVSANKIVIYPGASKGGAKSGIAFTVPDVIRSAKGNPGWKKLLYGRGLETGIAGENIAPRFATIRFNRDYGYNYAATAGGLNDSKRDFLSVAVHELGHAIGFGTSDVFNARTSTYGRGPFERSYFEGKHASETQFNTGVALVVNNGQSHWARSVVADYGLTPSMGEAFSLGDRHLFSELDYATLLDLGFTFRDEGKPGGSNDTLTTAPHVLTFLPPGQEKAKSRYVSLRYAFDRPKDVDIFRVYAPAGTPLSISVTMGAERVDPTIRLFDLSGKEMASHPGGTFAEPTEPNRTSTRVAISAKAPWTDYYYVAVSSAGNRSYDPMRAESGDATAAGGIYTISVTLGDPTDEVTWPV